MSTSWPFEREAAQSGRAGTVECKLGGEESRSFRAAIFVAHLELPYQLGEAQSAAQYSRRSAKQFPQSRIVKQ